MKHIGLFEGIGGFSLAARWMGWETVAWCEWNEFGQRVLRHHFPEAEGFGDITKTDFTKYANRIDILTGGFPCQPYSAAGKRLGKEDDRHLWPEMLRAIREIQPTWVVGENVLGLVNWNGGMVFDEVQADLEAEGYEVQPYVLPAASVGAPHRRDRVWFVAYTSSTRTRNQSRQACNQGWATSQDRGKGIRQAYGSISSSGDYSTDRHAADTDCDVQHRSNSKHEINTSQGREYALNDTKPTSMYTNSASEQGQYISETREREFDRSDSGDGFDCFTNFPTQSPICSRNDGLSTRLDGITFSKWRAESIKAAGNAIVPQVAHQIFKAIKLYHI